MKSPSAHETKSWNYCWLMWEVSGNTAMNLITGTRAAAIIMFGYGVGWSMAEFDTQQSALEMVPRVSGNQQSNIMGYRQIDLSPQYVMNVTELRAAET